MSPHWPFPVTDDTLFVSLFAADAVVTYFLTAWAIRHLNMQRAMFEVAIFAATMTMVFANFLQKSILFAAYPLLIPAIIPLFRFAVIFEHRAVPVLAGASTGAFAAPAPKTCKACGTSGNDNEPACVECGMPKEAP